MTSIATTTMSLLLFAVTSLMFHGGPSAAQAPALAPGPSSPVASGPAAGPSAGADCMTLLLGMADCLSYVEEGSNATKPDKACCPELKSLVDTNPVCLCELLANASSYGFQISLHRATELPKVCKVDTPPVSTCSLLGYPVGEGPTASEGPSPGGLPAAGEGSSAAPSPTVTSNGGRVSSIAATCSVVAVLVDFAVTFF